MNAEKEKANLGPTLISRRTTKNCPKGHYIVVVYTPSTHHSLFYHHQSFSTK